MTVSNALDAAFAAGRRDRRALFMPYLTGGFPEPAHFVDLAVAVFEAGADAIELGIPFSDPLLDGPVIQRSQQAALDQGVTPVDCLEYARHIAAHTDKPLFLMGAYNPLVAFGVEDFCAEARAAGVSGLIIPDLPHEEQSELRQATDSSSLHLIQMVAPTSNPERLQQVCAAASGFIYCISVAGVTGARTGVAELARPLVERIRACTDVPVAVGFGIASPEAAHDVAAFADGVIVGAALINTLADSAGGDYQTAATRFVRELRPDR